MYLFVIQILVLLNTIPISKKRYYYPNEIYPVFCSWSQSMACLMSGVLQMYETRWVVRRFSIILCGLV